MVACDECKKWHAECIRGCLKEVKKKVVQVAITHKELVINHKELIAHN